MIDSFVVDARGRPKPKTVERYSTDLSAFAKWAGGETPVERIDPRLLTRWLASLGGNATTPKAIMLRSVSAWLGWAERCEMLPANPAKKVPKPKTASRADAVIAPADHDRLMGAVSGEFRDVLRFMHATECRPGEACKVTAENFDKAARVVKLG